MSNSIRLLKKAYLVVHADNEQDNIYAGQPHVNKNSAVLEMSRIYRKLKRNIMADMEKIDTAWKTTSAYCIRTEAGAEYRGNIILVDLKNPLNLTRETKAVTPTTPEAPVAAEEESKTE